LQWTQPTDKGQFSHCSLQELCRLRAWRDRCELNLPVPVPPHIPGREAIYEDDEDCQRFLDVLAEVAERKNWIDHAYCLMTNHYHLVAETVEGNLSQGMRHLNGVYTQASNRRHGRTGHLVQRRFKGILV
jgi:hypothetical protein